MSAMASMFFQRWCWALLMIVIVMNSPRPSTAKKVNPGSDAFLRHSEYQFKTISECKGKYDVFMYAELSGICQDCADKYREDEIYRDCRKTCFDNETFPACLRLLYIEPDKVLTLAKFLSVIHPQHGFGREISKRAKMTLVTEGNLFSLYFDIESMANSVSTVNTFDWCNMMVFIVTGSDNILPQIPHQTFDD